MWANRASTVAGDQYGNYLIQYILVNATPQHHDIVANHIKCAPRIGRWTTALILVIGSTWCLFVAPSSDPEWPCYAPILHSVSVLALLPHPSWAVVMFQARA